MSLILLTSIIPGMQENFAYVKYSSTIWRKLFYRFYFIGNIFLYTTLLSSDIIFNM